MEPLSFFIGTLVGMVGLFVALIVGDILFPLFPKTKSIEVVSTTDNR